MDTTEMNDDYELLACPCCDGSGWDDETDDFCTTCVGWGMVWLRQEVMIPLTWQERKALREQYEGE